MKNGSKIIIMALVILGGIVYLTSNYRQNVQKNTNEIIQELQIRDKAK